MHRASVEGGIQSFLCLLHCAIIHVIPKCSVIEKVLKLVVMIFTDSLFGFRLTKGIGHTLIVYEGIEEIPWLGSQLTKEKKVSV